MAPPDQERELPLVPARMLNEHAYCPRLAYLEWVQGDFAVNEDVADGQYVHRRVDKEGGELPRPEASPPEKLHARSELLSAPKTGLIAKLDLIDAEYGLAVPVDYKRGEAPDVPEGAWEPERDICSSEKQAGSKVACETRTTAVAGRFHIVSSFVGDNGGGLGPQDESRLRPPTAG